MATTLRLEPESAALSIKRRIELIDQCLTHIRETVARYDGLKSFEAELDKHGVKDRVAGMTAPTLAPAIEVATIMAAGVSVCLTEVPAPSTSDT